MDDLASRLRQSEEQVNDLNERLKTVTSNVEQYRAMVVNLEESLNKEKQVNSYHMALYEMSPSFVSSSTMWPPYAKRALGTVVCVKE